MQEAKPILVGSRRRVKSTIREHFNQKWIPEKDSGCHLWSAAIGPGGYGNFGIMRRPYRNTHVAHRVSWALNRGPIPVGMKVLHKCDNPPCVNPDHLFLGTQRDNVEDCVRKGRLNSRKGEANCKAKLTTEQIRYIRSSRERGLGRRYGVLANQIYKIRKRIAWRHVP